MDGEMRYLVMGYCKALEKASLCKDLMAAEIVKMRDAGDLDLDALRAEIEGVVLKVLPELERHTALFEIVEIIEGSRHG